MKKTRKLAALLLALLLLGSAGCGQTDAQGKGSAEPT